MSFLGLSARFAAFPVMRIALAGMEKGQSIIKTARA